MPNQTNGQTNARMNWGALLMVPSAALMLSGCLTMEVIGKDIADSSTATIVCTGDAAGTMAFALAGDGTLSPPGPVTLSPPKYRAVTTYTPVPGTGLSRDTLVTCTYAKAAGGAEAKQGKIVVRETLPPKMVNLVVPAVAKVKKAFDVDITVQDPKNAGPMMVGWVSGIDIVTMTGSGAVRAVPNATKDFPGIRPGPPTHAKGPEAPPAIPFVAECLRPGAGTLRFEIIDTARNTLLPMPEALIECTW